MLYSWKSSTPFQGNSLPALFVPKEDLYASTSFLFTPSLSPPLRHCGWIGKTAALEIFFIYMLTFQKAQTSALVSPSKEKSFKLHAPVCKA